MAINSTDENTTAGRSPLQENQDVMIGTTRDSDSEQRIKNGDGMMLAVDRPTIRRSDR
ncbi:hypothetical protein [Natrinema sp. SYSU A 869]|uniref:hypothetical protein n=1 Tax=Natrinema sp. SYSU A 869 TaxID=2871694 RepID=UPI001CA3E017|nr:hypothetical protein [Natrinema sp. SYSU A 869]